MVRVWYMKSFTKNVDVPWIYVDVCGIILKKCFLRTSPLPLYILENEIGLTSY
jgi:hypothetical protein